MMNLPKKGFTLIELLIVVAIIAILAAIAIPNFLAAQVRSKVSRARADMRSIATGLESYFIDNNTYPLMRGNVFNGKQLNRPQDFNGFNINCTTGFRTLPIELTTPIAYLSSLSADPFKNPGLNVATNQTFDSGNPLDRGYIYSNIQEWISAPGNGFDQRDMIAYGNWRIASLGPDSQARGSIGRTIYDPTNGVVSNGEIIRTQKRPDGERTDPTSGID